MKKIVNRKLRTQKTSRNLKTQLSLNLGLRKFGKFEKYFLLQEQAQRLQTKKITKEIIAESTNQTYGLHS